MKTKVPNAKIRTAGRASPNGARAGGNGKVQPFTEGHWQPDPEADYVPNSFGGMNSAIIASAGNGNQLLKF